ncbi:MAG: hypothetical protein AAF266_14440, partial [Planctomycetota bacterium]
VLSAVDLTHDAEGQIELGDDSESASAFLAATLAEVHAGGGIELRFDCTSSDGCLLVRDPSGWWEMVPLPEAVLATYHRHLAIKLFGPVRWLLVKCFGGLTRYEPATDCCVRADENSHRWEARLNPTAIRFVRLGDER